MLNEIFTSQLIQPLFLTKVFFLLFIFFYLVFGFVLLKQVQTMNSIVIEGQSSRILVILAIVNLILTISLFLITLVIL